MSEKLHASVLTWGLKDKQKKRKLKIKSWQVEEEEILINIRIEEYLRSGYRKNLPERTITTVIYFLRNRLVYLKITINILYA